MTPRKPRPKKIIPRTTVKKSPVRKRATQEIHFLRMMKQGKKIHDMREEIKELHDEAFRNYLLREFGAGMEAERFRRFTPADLVSFRQLLIDGCNQWLRDAAKRMK